MALSEITRQAVLDAVAEFDRLGRKAFLDRYHFSAARAYFLALNDRLYDSKAILGAAHGYAFPNLGPLSASEFSGGEATVQRRLEELGFEVRVLQDIERATWIFQANPEQFDIEGYLALTKQLLWTVRQKHLARRMKPGDRVFLWRARGRTKTPAGIVASGWLVDTPTVRPDDPQALEYWRKPPSTAMLRVCVDIDRVARGPREVVQRDWLLSDPVLARLRILRLANETNYLLEDREASRLEALWKNTGHDWTYADSVAGLWAYQQTYGRPISRGPESPVAAIAQRIGRAVTGVYNKVMNFRAIDPRDTRKGLVAGDEVDRSVWDRFYDRDAQRVRTDELEAEFKRLWPVGSERDPDTTTIEEITKVTAGLAVRDS
jgi:hypothetical protein